MNKTLEYFLVRSGIAGVFGLRSLMMQHLLRMKALDSARLLGAWWRRPTEQDIWFSIAALPPLPDPTVRQPTLYMHQVLEAKLLGPAGTVLSIGTEFIDNRDRADTPVVPGRAAKAGLRTEGAAAFGRTVAARLSATAAVPLR